MHISPRISIAIFGWWDQPHSVLTWADVKTRNLTWRQLRDDYECSPQSLHMLQHDKAEWIHRGGLRLPDLPEMTMFPVNPLTDMLADIGELHSMQWDHDTLYKMGVTYEQMEKCGMSPKIMSFFRFPLSAWAALGLRSPHMSSWQDAESRATFGMSLPELRAILDGEA